MALDGVAVKSCTVLAAQADGHEVTTIEGLADPAEGTLSPVQQAFQDEHALQCGYCTPGMVMAVRQLLADHPNPTEDAGQARPVGQHLPLHGLPEHRRRRPPRRPGGSGRALRPASHASPAKAAEREG